MLSPCNAATVSTRSTETPPTRAPWDGLADIWENFRAAMSPAGRRLMRAKDELTHEYSSFQQRENFLRHRQQRAEAAVQRAQLRGDTAAAQKCLGEIAEYQATCSTYAAARQALQAQGARLEQEFIAARLAAAVQRSSNIVAGTEAV